VSALLALFVALTGALEERRYDIAILRLLGASRVRVALLLLLESWVLAAAAIAVGTALALGGVAVVASWLAQARSLPLSPLAWPAGATGVLALAWAAASLAALWPAWRAARMDLHQTLAQG
jgi:putative ABC transport system permease protein